MEREQERESAPRQQTRQERVETYQQLKLEQQQQQQQQQLHEEMARLQADERARAAQAEREAEAERQRRQPRLAQPPGPAMAQSAAQPAAVSAPTIQETTAARKGTCMFDNYTLRGLRIHVYANKLHTRHFSGNCN